jgi:hypothetical protein
MKYLLSILLALPPMPVLADVQPNEKYMDARCEAAVHAHDQAAVQVYCQQAAENHGTDAALESGSVKVDDLIDEADYLLTVGEACGCDTYVW